MKELSISRNNYKKETAKFMQKKKKKKKYGIVFKILGPLPYHCSWLVYKKWFLYSSMKKYVVGTH